MTSVITRSSAVPQLFSNSVVFGDTNN